MSTSMQERVVHIARWAVEVGEVGLADMCEDALSGDKVALVCVFSWYREARAAREG